MECGDIELNEFRYREPKGLSDCETCHTSLHLKKVEDIFKEHVKQWEDETLLSSSTTEILKNTHFRKIVELGHSKAGNHIKALILKHIHETPSHLFHSLHEITGENPLFSDIGGMIEKQCQAWVDWGKRKSLIWIPAKIGDIIEVIPSHYATQFKVGDRYIVIGVFSGDNTAVVMKKNGKIGTLCFPEEYIVVDTADNLYRDWEIETFGKQIDSKNKKSQE